jgi:hypothetical protein
MNTTGRDLFSARCDVRFSLQNRYVNDRLARDLAALGVSNRAVTVSGRATRSEKEISEEEFLGADNDAIRTALTRFLTEHELPRADDLVILDMEPRGFAPRALGDFEGPRQRELIDAYRRRIRVARQVLRRSEVPRLRLGLYQVIVPDGKGQSTDQFERRMCGYLEAGRQGMYDELDFICPVLYQRFGTDDAAPATLRNWVTAATRQGIEGSLALTRRNGATIPLVPILSFWVFNGHSANNRQAVSPDLVARQLQVVQDTGGVAAILFWSGWQTAEEMESATKPVEPIDINDFLLSVGTLPGPGCATTATGAELATVPDDPLATSSR